MPMSTYCEKFMWRGAVRTFSQLGQEKPIKVSSGPVAVLLYQHHRPGHPQDFRDFVGSAQVVLKVEAAQPD